MTHILKRAIYLLPIYLAFSLLGMACLFLTILVSKFGIQAIGTFFLIITTIVIIAEKYQTKEAGLRDTRFRHASASMMIYRSSQRHFNNPNSITAARRHAAKGKSKS